MSLSCSDVGEFLRAVRLLAWYCSYRNIGFDGVCSAKVAFQMRLVGVDSCAAFSWTREFFNTGVSKFVSVEMVFALKLKVAATVRASELCVVEEFDALTVQFRVTTVGV